MGFLFRWVAQFVGAVPIRGGFSSLFLAFVFFWSVGSVDVYWGAAKIATLFATISRVEMFHLLIGLVSLLGGMPV